MVKAEVMHHDCVIMTDFLDTVEKGEMLTELLLVEISVCNNSHFLQMNGKTKILNNST